MFPMLICLIAVVLYMLFDYGDRLLKLRLADFKKGAPSDVPYKPSDIHPDTREHIRQVVINFPWSHHASPAELGAHEWQDACG